MGYLGRSYSSDRYLVCGKRPLAIAAMHVELPPFKYGKHNSESAPKIDRVITPLTRNTMSGSVSMLHFSYDWYEDLPLTTGTRHDWVLNLDFRGSKPTLLSPMEPWSLVLFRFSLVDWLFHFQISWWSSLVMRLCCSSSPIRRKNSCLFLNDRLFYCSLHHYQYCENYKWLS